MLQPVEKMSDANSRNKINSREESLQEASTQEEGITPVSIEDTDHDHIFPGYN